MGSLVMNNLWIIILIPIIWYAVMISYQILKLLKLWLEFKIENIKEIKIWD